MTVDTNTLVSITEANQNSSKVARLVDEYGTAVIMKNVSQCPKCGSIASTHKTVKLWIDNKGNCVDVEE